MNYPRIGDTVPFGGKSYVLISEPCPMEDVYIKGVWASSVFFAEGYEAGEEPTGEPYVISWDVLPEYAGIGANDPFVTWEMMCAWDHPSHVE